WSRQGRDERAALSLLLVAEGVGDRALGRHRLALGEGGRERRVTERRPGAGQVLLDACWEDPGQGLAVRHAPPPLVREPDQAGGPAGSPEPRLDAGEAQQHRGDAATLGPALAGEPQRLSVAIARGRVVAGRARDVAQARQRDMVHTLPPD